MEEKLKQKLDEGYILVKSIIEIAGRPKEHIVETLKLVIKNIRESKNIILKSGDLFKAKETELNIKQKGKLWTCFAELELLIKDLPSLMGFCFDYMPSSIEIIEPSDLKLNTTEFGNLLNDMLSRLHNMDMLIKNLRAENKILNNNAAKMLRNIIMLSIGDKEKTIEEISEHTGILGKPLKEFLKLMIKNKVVKKEKDKYKLIKI
jgi:hypothetical protein